MTQGIHQTFSGGLCGRVWREAPHISGAVANPFWRHRPWSENLEHSAIEGAGTQDSGPQASCLKSRDAQSLTDEENRDESL